MRNRSHYLAPVAALAVLFVLTTVAGAESCSLELKKVDASASGSANYILRATYPQFFSAPLTEGGRFVDQNKPAAFTDVIAKDRDSYQAKHPARGVIKLGSQNFGYVLDSSVKETDAKEAAAEEEEESADTPQNDSLLSTLVEAFSGSRKAARDKKQFKAVPYDRLYFDRNHNGDLTDDEVIEATSTNSYGSLDYFSMTFPRIDAAVKIDATTLDYAFLLSVTVHSSGDFRYLSGSVNAAAYREGEITLVGKKHRVFLIDYNSNGRFDDQPEINTSVRTSDGKVYATQGDRLYIDPDLTATSRNPYGPATDDDLYDVSKLLNIDGRFYKLTVSPAGDKLSLEPSDVAVGYVSNQNKGFSAVVYGEKGFIKARSDESGKAPLPVGKWKLQGYVIDRTGMEEPKKADAKKDLSVVEALLQSLGPIAAARAPGSTMVSATGTVSSKAVEVLQGKTAELPFGPPYRPVVDVEYQQGGKQVSLGLSLVGTGGEICTNMQVAGRQPGKPSITITTADGEIVDEGQFEYG